jgi:hypothetical protein
MVQSYSTTGVFTNTFLIKTGTALQSKKMQNMIKMVHNIGECTMVEIVIHGFQFMKLLMCSESVMS